MIASITYMIGGLAVLVLGADWLVKGASRLALALGISPLVVGLTIVAFGTSAPELAVSVTSAYSGSSDIAVANVVGSNIFNVLLILGLAALVAPLVVHQQLIRLDVPIMIGASLLLYVLGVDGRLDLWDSLLLTASIVAYTLYLLIESRQERNPEVLAEYDMEVTGISGGGKASALMNFALIAGGLAGLVLGSKFFVEGAIEIARALGVSEVIIGLTLVAAGTSLPELATSVLAAIKGERDIAIGNIVGSNIFNLCSVLGFSGLASWGGLTVAPNLLAVDIPVMIGVALLCLPMFRTGYAVTRANGAVFVTAYLVYAAYLILQAQQDPALLPFNHGVLSLLLPALIIGTVVITVRGLRDERVNPS
jgi:cation:H+ antiporter